MRLLVAERRTNRINGLWLDADESTIEIRTRQRSTLRNLTKHPQGQLVEAKVDKDLKVIGGRVKLPLESVRIVLTGGESELEFRCVGKKRPTAR